MAPGLIDCKMDGGFCRGGILPESTRPKKHVENHAFFNDFKGCHRVPFTREKVPKSAVFTILEALQAHQVRTIVFRFRPMGCNLFCAQAVGSWLYTLGVPFFVSAPIAQLDRASGYGPEGLGFKSLWVYHFTFRFLKKVPFGAVPVFQSSKSVLF